MLRVVWKVDVVSLFVPIFSVICVHNLAARRLLKSLSIKQGIKYDDSESAKEIPSFIEFHGLNVDEILDPLDSFSEFSFLLSEPQFLITIPETFNQFFYR